MFKEPNTIRVKHMKVNHILCTGSIPSAEIATQRGKLGNHHSPHCLSAYSDGFLRKQLSLFHLDWQTTTLLCLVHLNYVLPLVNYLRSTCHMRLCYWHPGKGFMKRQNSSWVVPRAQKEGRIYKLTKDSAPKTKDPLGKQPQTRQ